MVMMGAALLGVVLTIFNVTALSRLSGERSKQQAEQEQSLSEADRVRAVGPETAAEPRCSPIC